MTGARILIVEDELIVAEDLKMTLETLGYEVAGISATGEMAITLAAEKKPDLILMDIMLAGELDGIASAERIRATQDIPVIYVTAYADEKLVSRAKVTEPYGYIVKPFNEREVHSNIEIALYRHRIEEEIRHRDAILLGLGTGIEWFLREFIAGGSVRAGPAARRQGRAGYEPLLESIGMALELHRIAVFRADDATGGNLSLAAEWTTQETSSLRNTPWGRQVDPAALGLAAFQADLRTGKPVILRLDQFGPAARDALAKYRFRSMVVMEVQAGERPYGPIFFVSDTDRDWSSPEIEGLRIATNIIGTAIGLLGRAE